MRAVRVLTQYAVREHRFCILTVANKISFPEQKYIKVTTGKCDDPISNSFEWNFGGEHLSSISTEWLVCEQFLAAKSSVFEKSLKKERMQHKAPRTLHFEDLDPGLFDIHVRWLEHRRLLDSNGHIYRFLDPHIHYRVGKDKSISTHRKKDSNREAFVVRIKDTHCHNVKVEEGLLTIYLYADEHDIP